MKSAVIEEKKETKYLGITEWDANFTWDGVFWDKRQLRTALKMKQYIGLHLE